MSKPEPLSLAETQAHRIIRDLNLDILEAQRPRADAHNAPLPNEVIQDVVGRAKGLIARIEARLPQANPRLDAVRSLDVTTVENGRSVKRSFHVHADDGF